MNKGGEMRPKLKIVIRPFWKKDTIGGLCPVPDMEYLRIEDEKGFLECEEKEMWTSP